MPVQLKYRVTPLLLVLLVAGLGAAACDSVRFSEIPIQNDSFQQSPNPKVDILWVVDNSGTMSDERLELGSKFEQFMDRLVASQADYHIGIISTDTDDPNHRGRLQGNPKVISQATPNPDQAFAQNVQLPETDSRTERGLDAMYLALSEDLLAGDNAGFLRSDAALFVIIVSDEDDHSIGPVRFYTRWLEHFKGAGNENLVSLSAIVGPAPDGCSGAEAGSRYLSIQQASAGLFHSICSDDYGPVVDELGISATGLRRKFYLSELPDPSTILVLNYALSDPECNVMGDCGDGEICSAGHRCAVVLERFEGQQGVWRYESGDNSIFFPTEFLPAPGSQIEVSYRRMGL